MNIIQLHQSNLVYPTVLQQYLGDQAPTTLTALGNLDILKKGNTLALFCSIKCPGDLILQTHDLVQALRQINVTIIGGFHSPIERECLTILFRGTQPIIICLARGIEGMRIRMEYRQPLVEGRLLLLSPFPGNHRRPTVHTTRYRNQFVAALADRIVVAYAEPSGKTEQLCRDVLMWGKLLYTLESDANRHLFALGAKPMDPIHLPEWA
ncbi:MAG: DNA-processing protein DprA [Candidatus Latescibacteria bacterium]|nr:DNA-processing protein DprA [Candidatus Latescibacterota bacterium]